MFCMCFTVSKMLIYYVINYANFVNYDTRN